MVVHRRPIIALAVAFGLLTSMFVAGPAAAAPTSSDAAPAGYLTDSHGRALVLHGLNNGNSAKGSPDGLPWTTESNIAAEADTVGSDAVRLLIFWSKVEPQPGQYDENYLNQVAQRVAWYRDNGINVILDMHQDLWGGSISGGGNDGAPAWATHTDGLPVTVQSNWALTYLQPGEIRAFDNFWGITGTHPELSAHFVAAWQHVAARFASTPNVLGYDLFNEPWGGSLPWPLFEQTELGPLYQRTINAIRQVDGQHWILVEPQAFGVNWGLPSALPSLADPRSGGARLAFAPHLYPALIDAGQTYTGLTKLITQAEVGVWQQANDATASRLHMPMVIGEFGLDATQPGALDYVDATTSMAAANSDGWLYWSNDPGSWGPYAPSGGWAPLATHLATPYPRAIAGTPVNWSYANNTLTVTYTDRAGVTGPTEIFFPGTAKPVVQCGPGCQSTWNPTTHVVSVDIPHNGGQHTITVTH